jgi:uncharacterized protein
MRAAILGFLLIAACISPAQSQTPAVNTVPVTFQSHNVILSGDITFPSTGPATAALILIQGSGNAERMTVVARILAANGFSVLTYDKRGVGQSGGVYEGQNNVSDKNLDLLADDAVAAFGVLSKNPHTNGLPAGYVGFSQAGWIAPLAALKTPSAKFIGLWAGPVCTTSEQLHFQDLTGNDADFWKSHTAAQVGAYMRSTPYRTDDVDPRKSLSKLSIPGLWLFGDQDNLIPVTLSASRLDELIRQGHKNFAYKIIPGYGHNILDTSKAPSVPAMLNWIRAVVRKN